MGERLLCTQEVIGSIPFTSTMGLSHYGRLCRRSPLEAGGGEAERHGTRHEEKVFAGALERPRGC